jgi:hypothetical protein
MLQVGRSPFRVPDEVHFFNLHNRSSRTMAMGSTDPLTEMSTRNLPGGKKRPARRADNLAPSMSRMSENVGASTSRNPKGLHGLYTDNFYCGKIDHMSFRYINKKFKAEVIKPRYFLATSRYQ